MTISDVNVSVSTMFEVSPISLNEWQVKTKAVFQNGEEIKIYLVNEKDNWYITDKKIH